MGKEFRRNAFLFIVGGSLYAAIEVLWRGYSHPALLVVGGLCFLLVGDINSRLGRDITLPVQAAIAVALVTAVEFASGCILNLRLELQLWDYSRAPLNLWGQICPFYMLAWIPLVLLAIVLEDWLSFKLFGAERPVYYLRRRKNAEYEASQEGGDVVR